MSKRTKRTKLKRVYSYDNREKEESTAGLMFLRVVLAVAIVSVVAGASVLCVHEFQETDGTVTVGDTDSDRGVFYQHFTEEEKEKLLDYCNESNQISKYYTVNAKNFGGVPVSDIMLESLQKMVDYAKSDGITLNVLRGYMSYDECDTEYKSICVRLESEGLSPAESEIKARSVFPPGGSNEYQTGMLIKVSDMDSEDFAKTDEYAWLFKNAPNFGFINRYTEEKKQYTGMEEDTSVFRFVGTENAQKMRSFSMCLEEYYDYCSYR